MVIEVLHENIDIIVVESLPVSNNVVFVVHFLAERERAAEGTELTDAVHGQRNSNPGRPLILTGRLEYLL